jgi:hypothetical protein
MEEQIAPDAKTIGLERVVTFTVTRMDKTTSLAFPLAVMGTEHVF